MIDWLIGNRICFWFPETIITKKQVCKLLNSEREYLWISVSGPLQLFHGWFYLIHRRMWKYLHFNGSCAADLKCRIAKHYLSSSKDFRLSQSRLLVTSFFLSALNNFSFTHQTAVIYIVIKWLFISFFFIEWRYKQ